MNIAHNVTIDLLAPRKNVVHLVQEDSTRSIRLTLMSGGALFDVAAGLSEGETLLKFVEFRRPNNSGGIYDTTSTGETAVVLEDSNVPNVWLVALDGQCFTVPGWTQINVRFETEGGKRLHSFPIMVDVEQTASSDNEPSEWDNLTSISDLKAAVAAMWDKMFSPDAKQALLNLLSHVAYADEHGQDYYNELEAALFQTAEIVSISAVFDQGSAVIYDTDDLDTLKQYLTVTATYEDLSTREVTGYTLSGTLTEGTSTITVSYGGKTATFDVTVSNDIVSVDYIEADGNSYINIGFTPDQNTKIVLDYMSLKESGESFNVPIGVVSDTDTGASHKSFFFYIGSTLGVTTSVSDTGTTATQSLTVNKNSRKTFSLSVSDFSADSISYGAPSSSNPLTQSVGFPFYVFARNHGNAVVRATSKGRVYANGLSVYSNDVLVKHYVPAKNNLSNSYGLFETTSHTFYGNSGTGTITGA